MTAPEAPAPDDKDWTWTITTRCPDCGFDPDAVVPAAVPHHTRRYVEVVRVAALSPRGRVRPSPTVWSPLEYACHVRDVCVLFDRRLALMLDEDDPLFDNWDQDETARAARYWEQQPSTVARELVDAGQTVADRFGRVAGEQWRRPGRRSNGSAFTIESFARYFLHDLAHHAWDVAPPA